MFKILKEFSLLNLILSPIISFIVVIVGVYLGLESYKNQAIITQYFQIALPPVFIMGTIWFLLGVLTFTFRKYSSWIGRLGNVFIIAGILNIGITLANYFLK
ncbi:MAG: hypothetical protein QXU92_01180 [Candidatus Diapherotrites archaeon]